MFLILMVKFNNSGATAVEYGLLVALLALAILSSVQLVESGIGKTFNELANELQ